MNLNNIIHIKNIKGKEMKRSEASAMQKETIYGGDKKNNE